MLDSTDHMPLKYFENLIFGVEMVGFCHMRDVESVISLQFKKSVNH